MSQPSNRKTIPETEFGDFQTPPDLAAEVCDLLCRLGLSPSSIVEPTCGKGNLLLQALDQFPHIRQAIASEISPNYINTVNARLQLRSDSGKVHVRQGDFFQTDWLPLVRELPEPILIVGNPPWVTNAQIGALGGANLPVKSNFQNRSGLSAKMGNSNFDISESMLIQTLHWLDGRHGTLAMLCKTAVARKLLLHAWKNQLRLGSAAIYQIDAAKHFGAMVDACLFVFQFQPNSGYYVRHYDCFLFDQLTDAAPERIIGYRDQDLVSQVNQYELWKHLRGKEHYRWRSGIKHDCAKVMELVKEDDNRYRNGLGHLVELEADYLYPMLKTSEVAKPDAVPSRYMLVPQTCVGEDTKPIQSRTPQTWRYLESHGFLLDQRRSSIYQDRPRFSIFGIGDYSFAPWKVAISGFYKRLGFRKIGPMDAKPVMLDDASYFVACRSEEEADLIAHLLNSPPAKAFFESYIFWDAKRPITIDLLRRLDLSLVAHELGLAARLQPLLPETLLKKAHRFAAADQPSFSW